MAQQLARPEGDGHRGLCARSSSAAVWWPSCQRAWVQKFFSRSVPAENEWRTRAHLGGRAAKDTRICRAVDLKGGQAGCHGVGIAGGSLTPEGRRHPELCRITPFPSRSLDDPQAAAG